MSAQRWDDAASDAGTLAHQPGDEGGKGSSSPPPRAAAAAAAYLPYNAAATASSSSSWGYGGAGMHEEHHEDDDRATPRRATRPHIDRHDSQGWAKLMQGAGYAVPDGDTGELDEAEDGDNGPLSTIRQTMKRLRVGTIAWICIVFALLWVPGLVALLIYDARPRNNFKRPAVWKIGIFWWSVWLSAGVWLSYWAVGALSRFGLRIIKPIFGGIPSFKLPIAYLFAVRRYVAFFLWALCIWVTWLSIIVTHFNDPHQEAVADSGSLDPLLKNGTSTATGQASLSEVDSLASLIVTIGRALFGIVLCAALLLGEKISIQSIAYSFHRVSYETRIAESKFHVKVLVALYSNARTDLSRNDVSLAAETQDAEAASASGATQKSRRLPNPLRMAQGVRRATRSSASVLGSVARDMAASSGDAAPFSPRAIVLAALGSAHETRRLARRIFWSYASVDPATKQRMMNVKDIAHCFPDTRTARAAMESLDKDSNATIGEEECEAACLEIRRERIGLMSSMHDIDSAVAKLDHIFMSLFATLSCLIIAALLSTKVGLLVASLGSMVLGFSWLLSGTAQEALGAILFVFVKHPYDIGDHVVIPGLLESSHGTDATFIVHEIQLLSSVFKTTTGKFVQMGNAALAQRVIVNLRRSGPIEEELRLDVEYTTTLQQIELLRTRMLAWIETQGRDFLPGLDIEVQSLSDQTKMTLICGIRFKSNWQNSNLRTRRRNRWICTLKLLLEELKIYGPSGDPHAVKSVQRVAMVDAPTASAAGTRVIPHDATSYQLMDDATYSEHNVYGEGLQDVVGSRSPSPGAESTYGRNRRTAQYAAPMEQGRGTTDIELGSRRV